MKRFVVDGILILILVSLGSALSRQNESLTMQQRLDQFNSQVENQQLVGHQSQGIPFQQVDENVAGQLGKQVSDFVIRFVGGSVQLISSAFGQQG